MGPKPKAKADGKPVVKKKVAGDDEARAATVVQKNFKAHAAKKAVREEQDYQKRASASSQTGGQFSDADFAPNDASLGAALLKQLPGKVEWRRGGLLSGKVRGSAAEAAPSLFDGDICPGDVAQGTLGDCWLLSSISSLAEFPGAVRAIFAEDNLQSDGRYTVRIFAKREATWMDVTVDDFFPCRSGVCGSEALFAKPDGGELWVCVLEKAFAKFLGSYANLQGGFPFCALEALTGDLTLNFTWVKESGAWSKVFYNVDLKRIHSERIQGSRDPTKISTQTMFRRLKEWDEKGYLCVAGTDGQDQQTMKDGGRAGSGIVDGHAYSIIHVKQVLNHQLLCIRNPWGQHEWNGDWSDKSDMWSKHPQVKKKLYKECHHDGQFWMCMTDFQKHFGKLSVCKLGSSATSSLKVFDDPEDARPLNSRERMAEMRDARKAYHDRQRKPEFYAHARTKKSKRQAGGLLGVLVKLVLGLGIPALVGIKVRNILAEPPAPTQRQAPARYAPPPPQRGKGKKKR